MSALNEAPIAALEESQPENTVAVQSQSSGTNSIRGPASFALRPDAPIYRPPFARAERMPAPPAVSIYKPPFARSRETPAPQVEVHGNPAPLEKPEPRGTPANSSSQSIMFDAYAVKVKPNSAERKHLIFIQRLHAEGKSKEEILNLALEEFPDLCKGHGRGTEEARRAAVSNTVELNTSRWADKYI